MQLWRQCDNLRARKHYEGRGFRRSGRGKIAGEPGAHIEHYQRALWACGLEPDVLEEERPARLHFPVAGEGDHGASKLALGPTE